VALTRNCPSVKTGSIEEGAKFFQKKPLENILGKERGWGASANGHVKTEISQFTDRENRGLATYRSRKPRFSTLQIALMRKSTSVFLRNGAYACRASTNGCVQSIDTQRLQIAPRSP
jgi:hypothetical protein